MCRLRPLPFLLLFVSALGLAASAQSPLKEIPLPGAISGVKEEFSGMAIWNGRLYLLPQYGGRKDSVLRGELFLYSIRLDSVRRVIAGKDTALRFFQKLRLTNADSFSENVPHYQGFEAISIVGGKVFLAIETDDKKARDCYIIGGTLDTVHNEIILDPKKLAVLPRPNFIPNAGFESLTWLPREKKLLALFEFNAAPYSNRGYLIDTCLTRRPSQVPVPFSYFRITDAAATRDGIFALNYYWNGDYNDYLDNCLVRPDGRIADSVPGLRPLLAADSSYLRGKTSCLTRILKLSRLKGGSWKEERVVEAACSGANWEGLLPLDGGFLLISDANDRSFLRTVLVYVE